jgi:hypothetical protein
MDTIRLSCSCGQHIEVNRNAAGQRFRCPACDILLAVPHVSIKPGTVATNPSVTGIQLAKRKFKQAIILSVVTSIAGVVLGVAGVGIHQRGCYESKSVKG